MIKATNPKKKMFQFFFLPYDSGKKRRLELFVLYRVPFLSSWVRWRLNWPSCDTTKRGFASFSTRRNALQAIKVVKGSVRDVSVLFKEAVDWSISEVG